MLTGMIPPTSGDARVRGLSLSSDMSAIRQSMGVCPQHDTLFPELTVSQHLHLFGLLKGVPSHLLRAEVDRMIAEVSEGGEPTARPAHTDGLVGRHRHAGSPELMHRADRRSVLAWWW